MSGCIFTLAGRSSPPSKKAQISASRRTLSGRINLESQGRADRGVGGVVVVAIAVVVDIRKVRGVAAIS